MRFGLSRQGGHRLRCPYKGCEKEFVKPTVLTDSSGVMRESFFACPFCMSRVEVVSEGERVVGVRAVDYPAKVFDSPAKCAHFGGVLGFNGGVSDECLVCPKVLQCDARKK